jgi:hypothetical protein
MMESAIQKHGRHSGVDTHDAELKLQRNQSNLGLDRVALTGRTGLQLPSQLPIETWRRVGRQLFLISDSSGWWLGDWLLYGEINFPDRYKRAVEETGLDYQTLRNYAWVARRFPPSRRRDKLSLAHHAEVAAVVDDEQDRLLAQAEQLRWSRNRLRAEMKARRSTAGEGTRPHEEAHAAAEPDRVSGASDVPAEIGPSNLRIPISAEQERQWRRAAHSMERRIEEWASLVLDEAASRNLHGLPDAGAGRGH